VATQQSTIDELMDRLADSGRVHARKMFGEYCVYLDDKPVALVCDDVLYVKPTDAGRALAPMSRKGRLIPGPGRTWLLRRTRGRTARSCAICCG
jgi:TfoX-like protein